MILEMDPVKCNKAIQNKEFSDIEEDTKFKELETEINLYMEKQIPKIKAEQTKN